MKYKRLSINELKELEKEFVNFLASAQITGPDWEKLKTEKPKEADELVDVFSDLAYQKSMDKINYLEFRDAKNLHIFHFGKEKASLIGLSVKATSNIDFTANNTDLQWNEETASEVSIIRNEKVYTKERGEEIFELIEKGCLITDGKLFNALSA